MADDRKTSTDEQEQIGRTTDENATGAADEEFEDADDDVDDEEDEDTVEGAE